MRRAYAATPRGARPILDPARWRSAPPLRFSSPDTGPAQEPLPLPAWSAGHGGVVVITTCRTWQRPPLRRTRRACGRRGMRGRRCGRPGEGPPDARVSRRRVVQFLPGDVPTLRHAADDWLHDLPTDSVNRKLSMVSPEFRNLYGIGDKADVERYFRPERSSGYSG